MVLISHMKSFIYIKNKKVASTSVEAYFEKYCLDPNKSYNQKHYISSCKSKYGIIGYRGYGKNDPIFFNHMNACEIKDRIGDDIFNKYFKFCVIRNPYDKMVSKYFMFKNENESFKEFCKRDDCININIYSIDNKPVCDYYIRYENLYEDLKEVCKILDIEYDLKNLPKYYSNKEFNHLRKKNWNDSYDYRKYYDEETRKIVYKKHIKEFELWNYKF